jgi:hypothetical protein
MPQIENVTQIKIRMLEGGHPNGVKHEREKAVTREYRPRYRKALKKEKSAILAEFIRLTGYHRKSAIRLLSGEPVREVLICADGRAVKLKPEKSVRRTARGSGLAPMRLSPLSGKVLCCENLTVKATERRAKAI